MQLVAAEPDLADKVSAISFQGVKLFNDVTAEQLVAYSSFWRQNDYLVINNALTEDARALLEEKITFDKLESVEDARQFFRVHNDKDNATFIRGFLDAARPFYGAVLALDLLSSYGFAMKYIRNSDMDPHYDNIYTPVSSTVCYKFLPPGVSNPLYFDKARFFNPYPQRLTVKDRPGIPESNVVKMDLMPGDMGIFRGRTHLHWREFIETDMDYRALLLHFSDFKYKGELRTANPIPHIPQILVDVDNYDEFRKTYSMYFEGSGENWI